jgi:hypothetical protein
MATYGERTVLLHAKSGLPALTVLGGPTFGLTGIYLTDDASVAMASESDVFVSIGSTVQRYSLTGSPLTLTQVGAWQFPGTIGRDIIRLADGRIARFAHDSSIYAAQVSVWNGSWVNTLITLPADGGSSILGLQISAAQGTDGNLYMFCLHDASATISVTKLAVTAGGAVSVIQNLPRWLTYPTDGAYGPYKEFPWMVALADSNTGKIALAYLTGAGSNGNGSGSTVTSPDYPRFPRDSWTYLDIGVRPAIVWCDAALSKTFSPQLMTLHEKTCPFGFSLEQGVYRLGYCPIASDMSYNDLWTADMVTGAAGWSAPKTAGVGYPQAVPPALMPGICAVGGPDGHIKVTSVADPAPPDPTPIPPDPIPVPPSGNQGKPPKDPKPPKPPKGKP